MIQYKVFKITMSPRDWETD